MDVKNLRIDQVLSAVDTKQIDPVFALTEELSGKRRTTLIAALEERIEAETPLIDESDDIDDDNTHQVLLTPKVPIMHPSEPERVPGKREMRCALKSDAPDKVACRGRVVRTFNRKDSPYIVDCDYWRAVLSRTGLFEEVTE